ncbi:MULTISPECIES: carboxymuconolactone decarboxylase family protein [unclassified Isoptericola]|uniref:carboxymuconolactone decarboxylase family protein n=1 Tax=unclassified Isoptericola TaxID=2623355 RepID=UPI00365F0D0F
MSSTFRIPRKELSGLYGRAIAWYARRTFGQVPDSAYVLAHHRPAMRAMFGLEMKVARWKALDPTLKTLAEMATAAAVGCSWCLDFGYFLSREDGLDPRKVSQVPRWRDADVYTELERDVMAYAEAVTATPPTVTDEMVAALLARLGAPALVELTEMVAVENMRSRSFSAAGVRSQGYSDVCELPLASS